MKTVERFDVEGQLIPANGYVVVQQTDAKSPLIVIGDVGFQSGVVVRCSADDEEDLSENDYDWKPGDLIFFTEKIEVDGETLVHWTDVVAYRRFS